MEKPFDDPVFIVVFFSVLLVVSQQNGWKMTEWNAQAKSTAIFIEYPWLRFDTIREQYTRYNNLMLTFNIWVGKQKFAYNDTKWEMNSIAQRNRKLLLLNN